MSIINVSAKHVTKIEYLGPHEIFNTSREGYSISLSTECEDEDETFEGKISKEILKQTL